MKNYSSLTCIRLFHSYRFHKVPVICTNLFFIYYFCDNSWYRKWTSYPPTANTHKIPFFIWIGKRLRLNGNFRHLWHITQNIDEKEIHIFIFCHWIHCSPSAMIKYNPVFRYAFFTSFFFSIDLRSMSGLLIFIAVYFHIFFFEIPTMILS